MRKIERYKKKLSINAIIQWENIDKKKSSDSELPKANFW